MGKRKTSDSDSPTEGGGKKAAAAAAEATTADVNKGVVVIGTDKKNLPVFSSFSSLYDYMPEWLVSALCKNFPAPMPIQAHAWGAVLTSHDVIAIAQTGSGKTLAFGLPALAFCISLKKVVDKQARVLVVAPTRELAMQTARVVEVAHGAAKTPEEKRRLGVACVFGGVDKHSQRQALRTALVVVATPGRLQDMVGEGAVDLGRVNMFVLDEADRMLDMGFERDMRNIAKMVHQDGKRSKAVQTLMFSATWPQSIRRLASDFLRSGDQLVRINVGGSCGGEQQQQEDGADDGSGQQQQQQQQDACMMDGGGGGGGGGSSASMEGGSDMPVASKSITQHVQVLEGWDKDKALDALLKQHHSKGERAIIFCLYKKEAARVESSLQRKGWPCVALHGDMTQAARTNAFDSFREKKVSLLIATDVASRGVDLPNVEHVINYTFPLTIEDYVHRIGRTGRGGATGTSHTFFTKDDKAHAGSLVNVLRGAGQQVPESMFQFSLTTKKKVDPTYGAFGPKASLIGKTATKITFDSDGE